VLVGVTPEEARANERPAPEVEDLVDLPDRRALDRGGVVAGPLVQR
jgi:hypothetical protein